MGGAGKLDPGGLERRPARVVPVGGDLQPGQLLGAQVHRRHAAQGVDRLDHRGARARVGVEARVSRGTAVRVQLRVVSVPGQVPGVAVGDKVVGALPGGGILAVAASGEREGAERGPGPAGDDGEDQRDDRDVHDRAVAEDLHVVQPGRGVRVPVLDPPHFWQHQGEQQDRHQYQPPQVADQLAVHQPGGDERRKVRRVCHLVEAGEPVAAQPLDLRDDLPDDVVAERGVERVARVVKAVVRVDLVAVLDPDPLAARQPQVGGEAQPGAGDVAHGVRRLQVPGQVAVVVADRVDDLPAALGHPGQGLAQVVVRLQDVGRSGAGEGQHLHDVAGQHDGQRNGLPVEPPGDDLTAPAGYRGPFRRQVQVADRDDLAAGLDGHVEQFGDINQVRRGRGHDRIPSPGRCHNAVPGQTDR